MLNLLRKADDMSQQATIWYVPLPKLEDNPYQTRQRNDPDHVLNLAASLVQMAPSLPDTKGLQQLPVGRLVRYADGYAYPPETYDDEDAVRELLAGNDLVVELSFGHSRRLAFLALARGAVHVFPELAGAEQIAFGGSAFDAADYAAMPVLLRPLSDEEMWAHAITENSQRRDLTAIEEAIAIERARKEFHMTYDQAGKLFGKSRGAAANLVRLLQLPDVYQQAILDGKLTERHGRALLPAVKHPEWMADKFSVTIAAQRTALDLERLVDVMVRQHENWLESQARRQRPALFINELVGLTQRFLVEQWGRDLPDNPAHTNGTMWREITDWLGAEKGATHRWLETDLKFAIKQAVDARRIELARNQPPAPPVATTATATYTPTPLATADQIAAAFAAWLRDATPTDAQLIELSERWTFAALWWPMLTALKAHCNGAGIIDRTLAELLDAEIAVRQQAQSDDQVLTTVDLQIMRVVAFEDTNTPQWLHVQQAPVESVVAPGSSLVDVFATQQPAIFDAAQMLAWQGLFTQALDAIGAWAQATGHQPEAAAAARALRIVVEKIENDL
jgi:ParB/RepB/Spo0J family partition protein